MSAVGTELMLLKLVKTDLLGAAFVIGLALAPAQAATLTGDAITGKAQYNASYNAFNQPVNTAVTAAIVGAGTEFSDGDNSLALDLTADIGASTIDIVMASLIPDGNTVSAITFLFGDLNFDDNSIITGILILGNSWTGTPTISWTNTSISIAFAVQGLAGFESKTFSAQIQTSPVPLPAALPLFAAGLGAMGFMGWRRNRRAV
jgi:hypothetical protein